MAFTRARIKEILKECGIESIPNEMVTELVELHINTQNEVVETKTKPLQEKIDSLEKLDIKETKEYKAIEKEFNDFKDNISSKETLTAKTQTLEKLLEESGANKKFIKKMIKELDLSVVEIEEGKVKGGDKIIETLKSSDWGDMFGKVENEKIRTNEGNKKQNSTVYTKDMVAKMTADEINSNWEEISKQLGDFK